MTPKAIREAERARQREESLRVATRHRKGKLIDQARYWEGEVDRIGKLLAKDFDSVKIAKQLHWAIERGRAAQEAIRPFFHPANVPGEQMTPTRRHAGEFKYIPQCLLPEECQFRSRVRRGWVRMRFYLIALGMGMAAAGAAIMMLAMHGLHFLFTLLVAWTVLLAAFLYFWPKIVFCCPRCGEVPEECQCECENPCDH